MYNDKVANKNYFGHDVKCDERFSSLKLGSVTYCVLLSIILSSIRNTSGLGLSPVSFNQSGQHSGSSPLIG